MNTATKPPPIGVRLNNPCNLEYFPQIKWDGLATPPNVGRFCHFTTPQYGYRAAYKQLEANLKEGHTTIDTIVCTWAPPSENDTAAYQADVSQWTGIPRGQAVNLATDALPLLRAISRQEEGGIPFPDSIIQEGIDMAQPKTQGVIARHVSNNAQAYGGIGCGAAVTGLAVAVLDHFGYKVDAQTEMYIGVIVTGLLARLFPPGASNG